MGSLYAQTKIFHFKDKLDSLPESVSKIMAPIQVRIKPTNFCNHRCSYCSYRTDNLQLGKDMQERDVIPREKILEIIDDFAEIGVKAVTFSGGGEPLCYPYIVEAVEKLSQSPIKFAAITNGSLLRGKIAKLFAAYGSWIRISIDGWDDESYARYREIPRGAFSEVVDNIRNFKKLNGKCYLGISIIVDRENAPHVHELAICLFQSGANSVKVSPCIVSDSIEANNNYHLPIFELVKEQLAKIKAEIQNKHLELYDSYHYQLETFGKDYHWCPYLQICPVIGADLNVYSCHDKAYNLKEGVLGSLKSQRFKDCWFSDKNKFFKIDPSIICKHHCVVDSRNKMILNYFDIDKDHLEFV